MTRTKKLALSGLIVALDVVSARFLYLYTPGLTDRISMQFLANAMAGAVFGPWWALTLCVVGDLVGMFLNPAGLSFMPLITLACAARGLIYGLMLENRAVTPARAIAAVAVVTVVVELGMMPLFLSVLFENGWWATLVAKLPFRLITIPVYGLIICAVHRALSAAKVLPQLKDPVREGK